MIWRCFQPPSLCFFPHVVMILSRDKYVWVAHRWVGESISTSREPLFCPGTGHAAINGIVRSKTTSDHRSKMRWTWIHATCPLFRLDSASISQLCHTTTFSELIDLFPCGFDIDSGWLNPYNFLIVKVWNVACWDKSTVLMLDPWVQKPISFKKQMGSFRVTPRTKVLNSVLSSVSVTSSLPVIHGIDGLGMDLGTSGNDVYSLRTK